MLRKSLTGFVLLFSQRELLQLPLCQIVHVTT